MIFELDHNKYIEALPCCSGLKQHVAVESILKGFTTGKVFVDNPDRPTRALVWNLLDSVYLAGDTENLEYNQALARTIREKIMPEAKRRYVPCLNIAFADKAWHNVLPELLPEMEWKSVPRQFYSFEPANFHWEGIVPEGCTLLRIDEELLNRRDLQNMQPMLGWVFSFWRSAVEFELNGLGYCLLKGDTVVSWCLAVYSGTGRMELGLATDEGHRGQGYAQVVASACLDYCVEHQITPHWHCTANNLPSVAVAEKVGFSGPVPYEVLFCMIP